LLCIVTAEQKEHKELIRLIARNSSPTTIKCHTSNQISSQHKRKLRSLILCPVNEQLFATRYWTTRLFSLLLGLKWVMESNICLCVFHVSLVLWMAWLVYGNCSLEDWLHHCLVLPTVYLENKEDGQKIWRGTHLGTLFSLCTLQTMGILRYRS
jgi:hypothetical protein